MLAYIENMIGNKKESEEVKEEVKEEIKEENEGVKLLNQGTYGCVFRPGIECSGEQLTSKKYITKIQKEKETSNREVEIGKKIKNIKGYSQYFAPIIESCEIKVSEIKDEELEKCKFITKEMREKKYESNKIRYVGKETLGGYLKNETKNISQIESYFRKLINTHMTLLKGITKLNNANIMHFDLKENNIMCREKSGRPIIIDYGLSVNTENIESKEYDVKSIFFAYKNDYVPWCLDIVIINDMINNVENKEDWRNEKIVEDDVKDKIEDFKNKNPIMELIDENEKEEFVKNQLEYYKPLIEGGMLNMPSRGTVYDEVIKNNKSWDNYALSGMFLQLLNTLNLLKYKKELGYIEKYVKILEKIIMSVPNKRELPSETREELNKIFKNMERKEKKNMKVILEKDFKNGENYREREKKLALDKKKSLTEDEAMIKRQ
jgi:tRNA A-37 threonylcarbamoyl transferase component Bud32